MGIGGFLASQAERDHYRYLKKVTSARVVRSCDGEMEREVFGVLGPIGVDEKTSRMVARCLRDVEVDSAGEGSSSSSTHSVEDAGLKWSSSVGLSAFLLKFGEGLEEIPTRRMYTSAFTIGMGYLLGGLIPLLPYFFSKQRTSTSPSLTDQRSFSSNCSHRVDLLLPPHRYCSSYIRCCESSCYWCCWPRYRWLRVRCHQHSPRGRCCRCRCVRVGGDYGRMKVGTYICNFSLVLFTLIYRLSVAKCNIRSDVFVSTVIVNSRDPRCKLYTMAVTSLWAFGTVVARTLRTVLA